MNQADGDAAFELAAQIPEAARWSKNDFDLAPRSEYSGWVAVRDSELIGFVVTRRVAEEVELLSIGVHPGYRRKGVALRLLTAAMEKALVDGARKVFLEVRESNLGALAFYRRVGFRESGRRRRYYVNPADDAILMDAPLAAD